MTPKPTAFEKVTDSSQSAIKLTLSGLSGNPLLQSPCYGSQVGDSGPAKCPVGPAALACSGPNVAVPPPKVSRP